MAATSCRLGVMCQRSAPNFSFTWLLVILARDLGGSFKMAASIFSAAHRMSGSHPSPGKPQHMLVTSGAPSRSRKVFGKSRHRASSSSFRIHASRSCCSTA